MASPVVVVVGSLNADLVAGVERLPVPGETLFGRSFALLPGGKGANQAAAAARLGAAAKMVGQVGRDAQGDLLRTALVEADVDTGLLAIDERAPTGVALITTDAAGRNTIVLVAGANGTFTPDRLAPALAAIRGAAVLLLQLEIPVDTVIRAATEAHDGGALVLLDPAPAREVPDSLLALADYVTPNEPELLALAGDDPAGGDLPLEVAEGAAARLVARGARQVIVTLGARGALLAGAGAAAVHVPPFSVTPVDTTAAGDAFNGALAVALAERQPLPDALRFASAAAALSVTRPGAQPSLPSRAEVEALLQRTTP